MNKNIGSSFSDELKAAGLLGLAFSWGTDGDIQYGPAMTPTQIAAVKAVHAAHDSMVPPTGQILEPDAGAVLRALVKKGIITIAEARAEIKL